MSVQVAVQKCMHHVLKYVDEDLPLILLYMGLTDYHWNYLNLH